MSDFGSCGRIADFGAEIEKRYGAVKRARGCFLYTQSGARLLDMYLDGGAAILGWGAGRSRLALKNAVERGLTGCYAGAFPRQLERALEALLPQFNSFRLYTSEEKLDQAFAAFGVGRSFDTVWRPWLFAQGESAAASCAEFCLPFSWNNARVFAYKTTGAESQSRAEGLLPASEAVNAPLAAAYTRAVYDLIAQIPLREEASFAAFDSLLTQVWQRKGAYLLPKILQEEYKGFFLQCLDAHILVSPCWAQPSVVPYGAGKSVFSKAGFLGSS